jgi:hypothetical protein
MDSTRNDSTQQPVEEAYGMGPQPEGRKRTRSAGRGYKSPALAAWLSTFPGLGQIYVGYYNQGFTHAAITAALITALSLGLGPLAPLFGISLAFFWLYNILDAHRRAKFYNRAVAGLDGEELPPDIHLPGPRGSVGGGITLMVIGIILLLNTKFDVSLEWLDEWWPLMLIIPGFVLFWKGRQRGK